MKNKKKVILNLQEHGNRMLKSIGLSLLASIAFYFLHAPLLFFLFGLVTAILSITLFLLVVRENKLKSARDPKVSKTDRQRSKSYE